MSMNQNKGVRICTILFFLLTIISCSPDGAKFGPNLLGALSSLTGNLPGLGLNQNASREQLYSPTGVPLPSVPLSTNGRYIVDTNNNRFKLKAVNWYGASDTHFVVAGLDKQPISFIVSLIKEWGFNAVRLPFSNVMLHNTNAVSDADISANPQFSGLTPLQVYDQTVQALTDAGIAVVLNNHTTLAEWCCGFDYNGLWYHTGSSLAYNSSTDMWQADWLMMVNRYKNNKMVVAADLRNEVRTQRRGDTYIPDSPNWGSGDVNDWHKASQDLGGQITLNNPDLLVIVEGINWWGLIPILGSGERPHLKPIKGLPVHLPLSNKLVYSAHNYGYIGPNNNGDPKTSGSNITYNQMDPTTFRNTVYSEWGYVVDPELYYTAPVWVSEFGASPSTTNDQDKQWLQNLVDYLIERDLDFAFWPLNGNDEWGLVSSDWSRTLKDDWRFAQLNRLLTYSGNQGQSVFANHFANLSIGGGNDNSSTLNNDWDNGANKGNCPDGYRLNGLSQDQRALCTDIAYGVLWNSNRNYNVQAVNETTTRYHGTGDWAGGFTKYECPQNFYVSGFSKRWWGTSGILCAQGNRSLGNSCRTVWFDRGDNRTSSRGGDWASGSYKGQCDDGEYVGGIAQRNGSASALLCCL
ncbi:glycoside hydrolase, family 5 [Leptospira fainei serovar Hurstbridge str. BUT 6]|uniref:Glycoside hydrolase, family 5 n=1 Tax=Leptospira fainei serovar Hurstbridge str. BUT 6 TaxID=1193011 RepID=S3V3K2_9LEPT|nr:cellulase family glycosylhydrolase [Leptospira fainei]EPG75978.1 glycoside hydrolase, family 5 [Leptospira fainei serovar Hurstbridge str. BUT 6]